MSNPVTVTLPTLKKPLFIVSDVHLQAKHPMTFMKFILWLEYAGMHAQGVIILGDLFEVWIGDEILDTPMSTAFKPLIEMLQQVTQKIPVTFIPGNRDFLVDQYFAQKTGVQVYSATDYLLLQTTEKKIVLCHGDTLCTQDHAYQEFRKMVRNPEWRQKFLALPLQQRMEMASNLRDNSQENKEQQGFQAYMDVVEADCIQLLETTNSDILIHGHTHLPGQYPLAGKTQHYTRWVLSDWEWDKSDKQNRAGYLIVEEDAVRPIYMGLMN